MKTCLHILPQVLLPWYEDNKRDLPWRKDKDPYHIWVSEIMLQQTRVEAVKGYYARFLEKLPTVEDLANAPDDVLHKLWEGLGYYSRVRNLKKAAQVIVNTYGGVFPKTYEEVIALPGIGPYTAGAICSIAYDLPTPAVDGNVLRVLSRLLADETPANAPAARKNAEDTLKGIYPQRAGDFTQALMELGATTCGPNQKPDCPNCPCENFCKGYELGTAQLLPVRMDAKSAVCKINIDSDSRLAMTAAVRKVFVEKPAEFDPRKYLGPARDNMEKMYTHKIINVLGSDNKLEC